MAFYSPTENGKFSAPIHVTALLKLFFPNLDFRYYEVKLLGADNIAQIGWADLAFEPHSSAGEGVGDDLHSWAYDGNRVLRWYKACSETWGERWNPDSIVGCLADLDTGTLKFTLDGKDMGVCYANISFVGGLRPAMTASLPWASEFNFGIKGHDSFWLTPPAGYRGIGELINLHNSKMELTAVLNASSAGDEDDDQAALLSKSQAIKPVHKLSKLRPFIKSGLADATVESEKVVKAHFNYPTVIADRCSIVKPSKYYFEVKIVTVQKQPQRPNAVAVGIIDKAFDGRSNSGIGVGDCQHSWAFDDLGRVSVAGKWSEEKEKSFKAGDVIGVAINKEETSCSVTFYVNGQEKAKIESINVSYAAVPAVSLVGNCTVDLNFGATDFAQDVPEGHAPLNAWLSDRK